MTSLTLARALYQSIFDLIESIPSVEDSLLTNRRGYDGLFLYPSAHLLNSSIIPDTQRPVLATFINASSSPFSSAAAAAAAAAARPSLNHQYTNYRQVVAAVCFSLALSWLITSFITATFHLREYRGPFIARFTRLWLCRTIASGHSAQRFVDVNKQYGRIARIGPNNLVTDDPVLVRRILAARSHYTRGPWFDSIKIDPHIPNIVSERNPGKHNHLRYQMSAGYAGKDIEGLEEVVDQRILDFMDHINKKWLSSGTTTKRFDIARRIQYLAVDIITHISVGKPLGFIESDSDVSGFLATIEQQLPIVQHFSVILELNTLLLRLCDIPFLKRLIAPSYKDKKGIGMIMGISREVILRRFAPGAEPKKDMLGSFIKRGLSAAEVEMEVAISLVAGSDTTATSIRATLLAIISNPRVYSNLMREIDDAVANGLVSSPIRDEESRRLPYLQACIKEGLRRFPPITQLRERMVPPEGDVYEGNPLPAGTYIGINAWGLQLDPVFGPDADVFRPERWLQADSETLKQMSSVHELIFGHGTTRCLGIPIAYMNLNKIFFELFRRFDVTLTDPTKPWSSICYGIFFQKDLNVRISQRTPSRI